MSIEWSIYVLIDPRNGDEFYIGITCHTKRRMRQHIRAALRNDLKRYAYNDHIKSILESNLEPEMKILETIITSDALRNYGDASRRERFWIKQYKACGKAWCNDKPAIMNRS